MFDGTQNRMDLRGLRGAITPFNLRNSVILNTKFIDFIHIIIKFMKLYA